MLIVMAALMGLGGVLFPLTEQTALLIAISLIAMTTSSGGDRTAFLSIDMAILAQSGRPDQRTLVFSMYNLAGRLTKAAGSLMIAIPAGLQFLLGIDEVTSYKLMFFVYAVSAFCGLAVYWMLSPHAEPPRATADGSEKPQGMSRTSRTIMIQLSLLFTLDSLGGGFMVYSFMSYFFANRFDMGAETIAAIFFIGQLLNSVSILLAAPTAKRIGLILTMAASQGLANTMMIFLALDRKPAAGCRVLHGPRAHQRHGHPDASVLLDGDSSSRGSYGNGRDDKPRQNACSGHNTGDCRFCRRHDGPWNPDNRRQRHQARLQRSAVRDV